MKTILTRYFILLLLIGLLSTSCSTTKHLPEGQYLLVKNHLRLNNKHISTEDIDGLIKQKPNKKMFGVFRFNLAVHNFSSKGKETRFKRWMKNTIGEAPILLDTTLTNKSIKQINLYVSNKGYFNSSLSKNIKYKRKKAKVSYIVNASKPYTIKSFQYRTSDDELKPFIMSQSNVCDIKIGDNYDVDKLEKERERLTNQLKNEGFYYFSKEFINYRIDSSLQSKQMNIELVIKNPVFKLNKDSLISSKHERCIVENVYVYPDYSPLKMDTAQYDTLSIYIKHPASKLDPITYHFIHRGNFYTKPRAITQFIFLAPQKYFNLNDVNQTYDRLSEQSLFKNINIQFYPTQTDSLPLKYPTTLNGVIQMGRNPVQSISLETEGTNSSGNYGVAGNIVYQNKNIFRGAEIFTFKIRGTLEMQRNLDIITSQNFFNTYGTGAEANLEFPKFLIPIKQERFPKYFKPSTILNAGFDFQNRPDYYRYITNVSFGYNWRESKTKTHILFPIDINAISIFPDSSFAELIKRSDPKVQSQYTDHIIMALKYSFIFNNQNINKNRNFFYFRGNIESAGNLLSLGSRLSDATKQADGSYTLFNIRYSQYIRTDADFRYYFILGKKSSLACRMLIGAGFPYGNSKALPFEKTFNAGGSNDIRAWSVRSLGPGSYHDSTQTSYDKTGDFKAEFNIEHRFPIYKALHGAMFIDAGNIWLKEKNNQYPGSTLQFDKLYSQLAIGGGMGMRLDFSYFVIRIDAAVRLKDPALPDGSQWITKKITLRDVAWNFGIGYPF